MRKRKREARRVHEAMTGSEVQCGDKCHSWPSVGLYSTNGATALLLSSAAHAYTRRSLSRARTISFMAAQSCRNVSLPGKPAIISQRLQLSQLCGAGKRG